MLKIVFVMLQNVSLRPTKTQKKRTNYWITHFLQTIQIKFKDSKPIIIMDNIVRCLYRISTL